MAIRMKPYHDEETARHWLESIRWRRTRRCPACRSKRTTLVPNERPTPCRCTACRKHYSVRTGSAMDGTSLPLRHWVLAMHLLRAGTTLADFTRTLGIGPKAARRLERKIRAAWSRRQKPGEEASEEGKGCHSVSDRSGATGARRPRGTTAESPGKNQRDATNQAGRRFRFRDLSGATLSPSRSSRVRSSAFS